MKNTDTILSHLTKNGIISEIEAITRNRIMPSSLNKSINELRAFGLTISKTDYHIDNEYEVLDIPTKLDKN